MITVPTNCSLKFIYNFDFYSNKISSSAKNIQQKQNEYKTQLNIQQFFQLWRMFHDKKEFNISMKKKLVDCSTIAMRLPCHNHQNRIISGKLWTVHARLVHAKTQQPNELSRVSERSPQRTDTGRVYMILLKIYSLSSIFFTHLQYIAAYLRPMYWETEHKNKNKDKIELQHTNDVYDVQCSTQACHKR